MSTTTATERDSDRMCPVSSLPDAFQRIAELATRSRTTSAFYRTALTIISEHFQALYAAMSVCNAAESLDEQVTAERAWRDMWQRVAQATILESQSEGVALARLYDIDGTGERVAVLAVPLRDELQNAGAVAIVRHCQDRRSAELTLAEFRGVVALACTLALSIRETRPREPTDASDIERALAKAARFGSLTELAFAITNGLKTKFQFDQVVFGKVERGRVRIMSVSGMDALYPRSPGSRLISQAMEECLDSGETLCSAPGHKWSDQRPSRSVRLHQQWRSAIGDAAVASLPIFCDGHCVAVLSLVRPGQAGFPPGELAEVERLAGAYGPAVQLVARAGRSWLTLTRDNLREGCGWLLARNRWGRKLVAAAAILLVAWFCWGNIDYRVTMPCRLVPTRIHHFAAPFEGIVRSAHVEVGDRVTAGQLLYTLDTRDWEFRQRELQTEAAVLELEIAQATGTGELEQAALARARREVVLARLMGVQRRIGLAEVRAHRDGTIVAGDIAKMVGDVVPLGAPLLECVPNESLMVELRVRGKDAATIRPGQPGTFATIARPGARLACVVDRVEPAASVVDGEHVYLARAKLIQPPPQVPLGIDGVAVVEAGRRRVWWVALHRAIDYLRLNFWI